MPSVGPVLGSVEAILTAVRGIKPRRTTLYLSVFCGVLLFLILVILAQPDKAYALSSRLGFTSEEAYFSLHRQMRYGAVDWQRGQRDEVPVYLIGDSITEGLDIAPFAGAALNMGVSGERVVWLAEEIDQRPYVQDARCTLITLGVNDLAFSREVTDISAAYGQILDYISASGTVLVGEVLPVTKAFSEDNRRITAERIKALNADLKALCAAKENCRFLDWHARYTGADGYGWPRYYLSDGLHLGPAGYRKWQGDILDALEEATCL